ncbi:protein FAR1-RELATED SEQUENCE 11-like [Amaranthus tricolor]|uniref:protein FAR1-RELATED SEQUENCE 11-like n=1 Tax=Amaranthus tricolor TaxID=29722 RepID=UPI002582E88F|nr:protein FAR1-RELATED SEQUENCE 11-like [Amaranthus tricolor]
MALLFCTSLAPNFSSAASSSTSLYKLSLKQHNTIPKIYHIHLLHCQSIFLSTTCGRGINRTRLPEITIKAKTMPMLDFDLNDTLVVENDCEPFIGQTFESQEEAYAYYNNYAKRHGYVARKDRSDTNKHGKTIRRDFYCHRGGKKPLKVVDLSKSQRHKQSSKCECKAHMRITLKKRFDIFPEEWHVTKFVKEHNHELLSSEEMRFLPANRSISQQDEKQILLYKEAGLSVRQIIRVMELEKEIKHGELSFIERDVRNLFAKVKKVVGDDDVKSLLEYMKLAKQENNLFQYAYTMDNERRLEHLFWCQSQSFALYQRYGDVVVFDTTYKVNSYDMPCGIFVGVDNHGKTILFGCALLRNEKTSTFRWLMKTFVTIMKNTPKTIITDQDPWMSEAIATELPSTKHSYCIWHITSKFSCWFSALLRTAYPDWCVAFYEAYKTTIPEEFEHKWNTMIHKYNLEENKHIQGLQNVKGFWAPAYLRDHFFGGMITTGRSEMINAFIKKFVSSNFSLKDFVKQVDIAIQEIDQRRVHNNMTATLRPISVKSKSPLEEQAFKVFTPYAFTKFQEEFFRAGQYSIIPAEGKMFTVTYFEGVTPRNHRVFWDGVSASCSCKNFEFWGILCRHILRVFSHTDCFKIPSLYLPLRWHHKTLSSLIVGEDVLHSTSDVQTTHNIMMENEVDNMDHALTDENTVHLPPKSKSKGRPKKRREKGGKELGKRTKCCSICKQAGHTKPTCPYKENISSLNGKKDSVSSSQKRLKKTHDALEINPIFTLKY